jgi:hypothetical protein
VKRSRMISLAIWAVLAASPVFAFAEEGPMVIANKEQHPYLTLDPFAGSIGMTGLYLAEQNRTGGQHAKSTDLIITEDLSLGTGGAIVSKNLASWTAAGTVSLAEEWTTGERQNESSIGVFDTYDLQLSVLGATAFPFSAYATQTQNYVARSFAGMLRDTDTGYGATFHYNNAYLPSTLSIGETTTTQSTLGGQEQYSITQDELEYSTAFQPLERQSVSVNYHFAQISQSNAGPTRSSSQLQGVAVGHNWSIDPEGRYTLTQSLDYSQQSGNFPYTQLRIGEQLRMRHTNTLESAINYTYEQHDYATNSTARHNLSATVMHRLYDSLSTSARAGGSQSENSFSALGQNGTASTTNYFMDLAVNYQKKLWQGRLGASLALGFNQTDNSPTGSTQQVIGQVEQFSDPQPVILKQQGIDASSIAVFNAAGTQQLVKGVDYTVKKVGTTVRIDRKIGGLINSGDSVRVNYQVEPLPGFGSATTSFGGGLNYYFDEGLLKGLYLYGHYSQADQTITPADSGIEGDSVRDTVVGAEYRIWKLMFRVEDENHDSTLAPYDALRFTARYDHRLDERTQLSLDFSQNFIDFPKEQSSTSLTTVDGRMQYEISKGLSTILTVRWRDDDDSRSGTTTGMEEQLELRWKIRQTDIFGLVRYTSLETRDSDANTFFFQVGLSRRF